MGLGIAGKRAIICRASKGLGFACARSLAREGVHVVVVARSAEDVDLAAARLSQEGAADVTALAADVGPTFCGGARLPEWAPVWPPR